MIGETVLLFGESVSAIETRPADVARLYRTCSIGLRDLLSSFSLQEVPLAVFDYGVFADQYKGLHNDEISAGLRADPGDVRLPQIVYTANAADLYKPIGELTDKERSVVAIGFEEGSYIEEDEVAWSLPRSIRNSKLNAKTAEFWCDRLEMVPSVQFRELQGLAHLARRFLAGART